MSNQKSHFLTALACIDHSASRLISVFHSKLLVHWTLWILATVWPTFGQSPNITIEYSESFYEISNSDNTPEGISTKGTDFAIVAVDSSVTRIFTIRNDGDSMLSLSGSNPVSLEGGGNSHFQISQPEVLQLAPNQSTEFSVSFAPHSSGIRDGASSDTAGVSAFQILSDGYSQGDGVYWIDPDGEGPITPFQIQANMTRDGGGWTFGLKTWYQAGHFKEADAVGAIADALTLKGNPYKLSDENIRAIIGPSLNTDVLADQAGFNSQYSNGNFEYAVLRNYTGLWTWEQLMPPSSNPTLLESYRILDDALAWSGELLIGSNVHTDGAGINAQTVLRGPGAPFIQMGTTSNSAWHHFYMGEHNSDTYLYLANGAQHSSGHAMNHRFWFRERMPNPNDKVFATVRVSSDDPVDSTFDFSVAGKASVTSPSRISRIGNVASSIGDEAKVLTEVGVERGSNRVLLAFVLEEAGDLIDGVSFDGSPMTFVAGESASTGERIEIYILPLGSGHSTIGDVIVTSSAELDSFAGAIAVAAFENVDQENSTGSSTGISDYRTRSNISVAGVDGDLVAGAHFNLGQNESPTVSRSMTPLHQLSSSLGNSPHFITFTKQAAANSRVDTWWNENQNFATLAVNLHQADLPPVLINEVDSYTHSGDTHEFIELFDGGAGNTSLDGLALVFYEGSTDTSYNAIDLDGHSTNDDGYFVIGNSAVANVDLVIPDSSVQSSSEAVALYQGDATEFPNGSGITTTDLVDALLYGSQSDSGLEPLLLPGESAVNESANGGGQYQSVQRYPNGTGGPRETGTYRPLAPTPGEPNTLATVEFLNLDHNTDSGNNGDGITNAQNPRFIAVARIGALVNLVSDLDGDVGSSFSTLIGDPRRLVFIDTNNLSEGTHELTATADEGAASDPFFLTIDRTAPPAPSAPDLGSGNDSGISDSDDITKDTNLNFSGSSTGADLILLYANGSLLSSQQAPENTPESWSVSTWITEDGNYDIAATSKDVAGNESAPGAGLNVTIDTTAPVPTVEQAITQDDPATSGPIQFTVDFGEDVDGFETTDVTAGGTAAGAVSISPQSSTIFTVEVATTASEGFVTASIPGSVVTDLAGNPNAASTSSDNRVNLDSDDGPGGSPTDISVDTGSTTFSGFLHNSDTDTFTFTLTGTRIATLFTTGSLDTRGSLRDEGDTLLNDPDADDDAGDELNFRTVETLAAGDYTLDLIASGEGAYDLTLETAIPPAPAPLPAAAENALLISKTTKQLKKLKAKIKKVKKSGNVSKAKKLKQKFKKLKKLLKSL